MPASTTEKSNDFLKCWGQSVSCGFVIRSDYKRVSQIGLYQISRIGIEHLSETLSYPKLTHVTNKLDMYELHNNKLVRYTLTS